MKLKQLKIETYLEVVRRLLLQCLSSSPGPMSAAERRLPRGMAIANARGGSSLSLGLS